MATPSSTPGKSIDESSRFTIPKSQWPQVLLIAVALPVLLTVVDVAIAARLSVGMPMAVIVVIFSVYIAEMTAIAIAAGAGIRQTWLAWSLLAWLIMMIDLHLIVAAVGQGNAWDGQNKLPIAAFVTAQLGFLVVWAAIGGEKWYLRFPITFVIAGIVLYCWHHFVGYSAYHQWTTILFIELASIAFLSIALRLTGFRLHQWDEARAGSAEGHMQFGLRHVLVFITVLAILLGVARAAQMLTLPFFLDVVRSLKLWRLGIACPSAMLIVLAFWAALGRGSALLRIALITLGCVVIGFGMTRWSAHMLQTMVPLRGTMDMDMWERMRFWEIRYWWIAWYALSTGLLAACLLFFRARGYRIIRTRRIRSSA